MIVSDKKGRKRSSAAEDGGRLAERKKLLFACEFLFYFIFLLFSMHVSLFFQFHISSHRKYLIK